MRAFLWFIALVLLAGVVGAVLAYPAYALVVHLGAKWAFHRVASRIAMLVLAVELGWLCRHLAVRSKRDFGYGLPWRRFVSQSLLWGLVGMGSAALGAAFLLSTHIRVINSDFVATFASVTRLLGIGLSSGVAVALIEETVMRGAMHTAIDRDSGPWIAALLTAPLFAVLHFFARVHIAPQDVHWGSGFDLLALSFAPLRHPGLVLDAFLSWLAIGLLLSMTRVLTGNIAVAIGLHAGWVVILRMLQVSTGRGASPGWDAWVGKFDGLLGYWLLPWATCLGICLWLARRQWTPAASTVH